MAPQFHAVKAFLTYQHCEDIEDFSKEALFDFLFALPNVKDCTVGQENYPTEEGFHCHCLLLFNKKTKLPFSAFDYHGKSPFNQNFRSNSRAEVQRVREYCKKEGNFCESGFEDSTTPTESHWASIATATTRDAALTLLTEHYPRDAVLQRRNFDYWAEVHFKPPEVPFVSPPTYQFDPPPELSDWADTQLNGNVSTSRSTFFLFVVVNVFLSFYSK